MLQKRRSERQKLKKFLNKPVYSDRSWFGQHVRLSALLLIIILIGGYLIISANPNLAKQGKAEQTLKSIIEDTRIPGIYEIRSTYAKEWMDGGFESVHRSRYTSAVAFYSVENPTLEKYATWRDRLLAHGWVTELVPELISSNINQSGKTDPLTLTALYAKYSVVSSCLVNPKTSEFAEYEVCLRLYAKGQIDDFIGGNDGPYETGFKYPFNVRLEVSKDRSDTESINDITVN